MPYCHGWFSIGMFLCQFLVSGYTVCMRDINLFVFAFMYVECRF